MLRWLLAGLLLVLAALFAITDVYAVVASRRYRAQGVDRHVSMVSGGSLLLCAGAYVAWPGQHAAWVFLVTALDLGTWVLILGLPWAAWQAWRGK